MKKDRLLKMLTHTQLPTPTVAKTGQDFLRLMEGGEKLIVVSREKFEKALKARGARKMKLDDENTFIISEV